MSNKDRFLYKVTKKGKKSGNKLANAQKCLEKLLKKEKEQGVSKLVTNQINKVKAKLTKFGVKNV